MVRTRLQLQQISESKKVRGEAKRKRKSEKQMKDESREKEQKEEKREELQQGTSGQETEDIIIIESVSCADLKKDGNQSQDEKTAEHPSGSLINFIDKTPTSWGKIDFWGELDKPTEIAEDSKQTGDFSESTVQPLAFKDSTEIGTDKEQPLETVESPPKVLPLTPSSILRKANSPGGVGGKKIRRVQFKEDEHGPDRSRFGRSFSSSPYPKRLLEQLEQVTTESTVSPLVGSPAKRPMKAFGQIWPIGSSSRSSAATPTRWPKAARKLLPIQEKASPCDTTQNVPTPQTVNNNFEQLDNTDAHIDVQLEKLPLMDEQEMDDETIAVESVESSVNVCAVQLEQEENKLQQKIDDETIAVESVESSVNVCAVQLEQAENEHIYEETIEQPNDSLEKDTDNKSDDSEKTAKVREEFEKNNNCAEIICDGAESESTSMTPIIQLEIGTDKEQPLETVESPPKVLPLTPSSILRKANSPGGVGGKKIRRVQFKEDEHGPDRSRFGRSFSSSPYPKRLLEQLEQVTTESTVSPLVGSPAKRPMKAFGQIWPIGSSSRSSAATPTRWPKAARKLLPIQEKASPCDTTQNVPTPQTVNNNFEQLDNTDAHIDVQLEKLPLMDEQEMDDETIAVESVESSVNVCAVQLEQEENKLQQEITAKQPNKSIGKDVDEKMADLRTILDVFEEKKASSNETMDNLQNERTTRNKSDTFERIKRKLEEQQEKLTCQMELLVEESTKRMLAIVAEELEIDGKESAADTTGPIALINDQRQ